MPLTIEVLPDPAASDLRLSQLAAQRASPLERLNILHGSALQRLSAQRRLAAAGGGALAAVYGYTPVDLAQAAVRFGAAAPRQPWPAGADLAVLAQLLQSLPLQLLNPNAPGIPAAVLRTLTDLREAALPPDALPEGELRTIYAAWRELTSGCADRSSHYEDAVSPATPPSAFREALGGAPLIVAGIYDLTRIQRLLLARIAESTSVRMLLVLPSDDPASPAQRTLTALRRELNPRVIRSTIPAQPLAPQHYFSVADPHDEADQIARRILELGRGGAPFHRTAIFHQQGAAADDRLCAALERAGIPSWRIAGRPLALTPIGSAARTLAGLLLNPHAVERSALLDWLSHRALHNRLGGVERQPGSWERAALDSGLGCGLGQMRERLNAWRASSHDADADAFAGVLDDLSERSTALQETHSWSQAAELMLDAAQHYLAEPSDDPADAGVLLAAARDALDQLRFNDRLDLPWTTRSGLTAVNRAFAGRVVRDPRRLIGGVNVGAASGPARGIRYHAVFAAGVAERVFPAVGREDPLLTDQQRAIINAQTPDALALQRDRADSDRHVWALMRRAAAAQFSASWSRRSNLIGGPARASSLILEAASRAAGAEIMQSEAALTAAGRIERIANAAGLPPSDFDDQDDVQRWSRALDALDARSFDLELLAGPGVDIRAALTELWPDAAAAEQARQRRNDPQFTEFDGRLSEVVLPADWRPLERAWSADDLAAFVICPYRFYLTRIIGVGGRAASERPDRHRHDAQGRIVRQILSRWVLQFERFQSERNWLAYTEDAALMREIARPRLEQAVDAGLLGPAALAASIGAEALSDLDRVRRRETADARDGWRPQAVNVNVDSAPIRVAGGRTLRFRVLLDRIDAHADGRRRALTFFGGQMLPDVRGFVNGSSFQSVAALCALVARGVPIAQAEVEHRSVTQRGNFESETLRGALLTSSSGRPSNDAKRLRDALATIADQLEAGHFLPYPGASARERPNCARCPVESACTADVGYRYQHKSRREPDLVRPLETLRRQRP